MRVRSTAFATLTIVVCCLLPLPGQSARANNEPGRSPHHHKPATTTAAADLPVFQPGLWQYRRTVVKEDSPAPRTSVLRKCADPSAEIRTKMAQLGHYGCRFAPLTHRRGRYVSSWTCPTPLGPTRFRAVLIVRGVTGYTHVSEMRAGQHVDRQRIDAAWIGECSTGGPGR